MSQCHYSFHKSVRIAALTVFGALLANCSQTTTSKYSPRVVAQGQPVPKGGGAYRVGNPYVIGGRTYVPHENTRYRAEGVASWYGEDFHGRLTANGEVYDMRSITAAHPTLPLPSYVRVTNLENRRSLVVRVNDRGPFHENRVIDLSVRAAKLLGFYDKGTAQVRVDYVGRASLDGSDDNKLAETLIHNDTPVSSMRIASASLIPGIKNDQRNTIKMEPNTGPNDTTRLMAYAPTPPHSAVMLGRGLY